MEFLRKDWVIAIFIFVVVGYVITYFGFWWGLGVFLIGAIIIGWKDRHKGPFPTYKNSQDEEVRKKAEGLLETRRKLDEVEKENSEELEKLIYDAVDSNIYVVYVMCIYNRRQSTVECKNG